MGEIPFVAFGNDELEKKPELTKYDSIKCAECGQTHRMECGIDQKTGKESDLILFYTCGPKSYLAGVAGKSVLHPEQGEIVSN